MNTVKTLQIEQLDAQTILTKFSSLESAINQLMMRITHQAPDEFLTREEVAALLKVSKVTIWNWDKKGLLKPYRLGNHVRYKRNEVLDSANLIRKANSN
ncbi:helix-turn-helix transcriptional regulator [Larkinella sp. VNQ87]|uniref:helix-turn-helix transcriptional regulator n=1 Tax=Larkinella sp. VNQ87 TaxID=3400921 RepID=UPI003C1207DC